MKTALFIALGIFAAAYCVVWAAAILREHRKGATPDWRDGAIGFVTNFFDTLGIGSFAPTTSFFKLWRLVPDEQIPGTMNVGHTIPTLVEAFIYIAVVNVDLKTLVLMIGASVAGAWFGAGIVAKWPRRKDPDRHGTRAAGHGRDLFDDAVEADARRRGRAGSGRRETRLWRWSRTRCWARS